LSNLISTDDSETTKNIYSYFSADTSTQMDFGGDAVRISTDNDDGEYQR
jgi:hypothetical protein